MLDAISFIILFGILALVIYATVTKAPPAPKGPPPVSSDVPPRCGRGEHVVGVLCQICRCVIDTLELKELEKIMAGGEQIYCDRCLAKIRVYQRHQRGRDSA